MEEHSVPKRRKFENAGDNNSIEMVDEENNDYAGTGGGGGSAFGSSG